MDLIIFIVLCGIVIFFFKKFSSFIYFIAFTDIFLRIVTFIKTEALKGDLYRVIDNYFPENIPAIIDVYADGLLLTVFIWMYVVAFIIFESYIIRTFFHKK